MPKYTLKKALLSYRDNVKSIEELKLTLEDYDVKQIGKYTSSIISMPSDSPKSVDPTSRIIKYSDKKDKVLKDIEHLKYEVNMVKDFISVITWTEEQWLQDLIYDKYISPEHLKTSELAEKYNYYKSTLYRICDDLIDKYEKWVKSLLFLCFSLSIINYYYLLYIVLILKALSCLFIMLRHVAWKNYVLC